MILIISRFLLLLFVFLSPLANATEPPVTASGWCTYSGCNFKAGTPEGSARLIAADLNKRETGHCPWTYTFDRVQKRAEYYDYFLSYTVSCNNGTGETSGVLKRYTYEVPSCDAGGIYNPETQECEVPTSTPNQCYEQNLAYDPNTSQCKEVCENGELDGVCLNPVPDNEETCNESRPDYKGYLGNGNNRINFCANDMQCEGGDFGLVGDQLACIPNEYGAPECSGKEVLTKTRYGFYCNPLQPESNEEEPETPREPNEDTDGDGQPDNYNPDLDPSSIDKQLDQTNKKLDKVGDGIGKINSKLDLIYGAADELVKQGESVEEGLNDAADMIENNTAGTGKLGDDGLDLTENTDIQVPDILGDYTDVADPVVSECPAPRELVLGVGTFQVVWTPWCNFAEQIRPFVIFMFTFMGVMAVGRTVIA